MFLFGGFNLLILGRFFYWQVIRGNDLSATAKRQRLEIAETQAPRGTIYTDDGYPMVINKTTYDLNLYLPNLDATKEELAGKLGEILAESDQEEVTEATSSAILSTLSSDKNWFILSRNLPEEKKEKIEALNFNGVDFSENSVRDYPEASMAGHLLGFVGSDDTGDPQGYFGLEGYYHQQLSGRPGLSIEENNPFGQVILTGSRIEEKMEPGMNLNLHLQRPVQYILETELKAGIEKHQAESGMGVIIDPQTGAVLAMASFPNYHPGEFSKFPGETYSNPIVAEGFEPGSIFKPLIMAAAIEEGLVEPSTVCTKCDSARTIGEHTIRTFDDQYHPDSTMTEVMQNSDNVGMVFVSDRLGRQKTIDYLKKFGFGEKTGIDLQEEAKLTIRDEKDWYPIDVATASFGQGVLVTPIQFVRAFASLANGGKLVKPKVVNKIWSRTKDIYQFKPEVISKPISPETAEKMKEMLVNAVENGHVKWTKLDNLVVAGKTGTAQIPIAGNYAEDKTIGSFIGFAPADEPRFVMLISLKEPKTSPWGSNTAAPVWFSIAEKLSYYWGL